MKTAETWGELFINNHIYLPLWSTWLFSREINHNKQCNGLDSWFKQSLSVPELSEVQLCCPHRLVQQASARCRRLSASTVSLNQAWDGYINVISCTGDPSGVSCQASTMAGRPKRTMRVSIQPLAHGWTDRKTSFQATDGHPWAAWSWCLGGGGEWKASHCLYWWRNKRRVSFNSPLLCAPLGSNILKHINNTSNIYHSPSLDYTHCAAAPWSSITVH